MRKTLNPPRSPLVRGEAPICPSPDKGRKGGVSPFLPYNKNLTALARENRKNPTPAETRMWQQVLRMRQLAQHKFLRQKPIGNFIVDFYCVELRLAIEIDGHDHAEKAGGDLERTRFLNGLGLTVIRYGNGEVMGNIDGVYEDLVARIQNLTPTPPILPLCEHPLRGLPAYPASGEGLIGEGQAGEESTSPPLTRGGREGFENYDIASEDNPTP
ncbi:MAG: DUF559 domain-containing protein [Sulfuricella sp.]